jgi:hypothetical protein
MISLPKASDNSHDWQSPAQRLLYSCRQNGT